MKKQAKKKGLWLLCVFTLALAMLPLTGGKAWAAEEEPVEIDNNWQDSNGVEYQVIEDDNTKVRVYTYWEPEEPIKDLVIPSQVKKGEDIYDVTEIGNGSFPNCEKLESITLPNTVTSIGNYAFNSRSNLTKITLSNNLKSIGNNAFYHCTGLTSITLPNSLESIGNNAFDGCTGLTGVTVPESVQTIGSSAFFKCEKLESVTLPNGLTTIANNLFYECKSLTRITLPTGVTSIGNSAFIRCGNLESITLPDSVTAIGNLAFSECTGLTSITLPSKLDSIGYNAFLSCRSLTSITLPTGVTTIGENAFDGCTDLCVNITGNSLSNIGDNAFNAVKQITCRDPKVLEALGTAGINKDIISVAYNLAEVTISPYPIPDQLYTGEGITPGVTLTLAKDSISFTEDKDYTLTYEYNTDLGTGKITINVKDGGSLYGGPIELPFNIYQGYTVTFDGNGASSGTMDSKTVRGGSVYTLLTCEFTPPEGKEFNGWQIGDDNTKIYPSGYEITIDSDTTITATWKEKSGGDEEEDPGNKPNPGEEEDPGNKPNPGEEEDPGNKPNPGEEEDPGNKPNPGEEEDPGNKPNPGEEEDPGNKPNPGEEEDPGNKPNPGEEEDPDNPGQPTTPDGTYTITFEMNEGTLVGVSNPDYVTKGQTYKMPSATKSGYKFRHWAIGDEDSSNTVNANEVYTFTADTWVYAIWEYNGGSSRPGSSSSGGTTTPVKPEKPGTTNPGIPGTSSNTVTGANINNVFADVKNNAWYAEAIAYVYNKGIMNGTGNGQFEPNSPTTRAMLVTMLYRLEKEPGAGAINFGDVASGQWYSQAIAWGAANGIVKGYSETQFAPEDKVTREQLAAILFRYAQFKGLDVSARGDLSSFSDSGAVSAYAVEAMEWAVGSGLMNGDNGALRPAGNATRAEMAMMLMRYLEK